MNGLRRRWVIAACAFALAAPGMAMGAEITRWSIDAGGGSSSSARFAVKGTLGQADADPLQPSVGSNGRFAVTGGFWASVSGIQTPVIFRNGFED